VEFRIERVEDRETWELRQSVLRPHQSVEQMARSDRESGPGAAFALLDPEGAVVGTARVAPGEPGVPIDGATAAPGQWWRLRGMTVRPELRNRGWGGRLLATAVDHVERQGGRALWCNARVSAIGLYRRAGFVVQGEPWEEPDIGAHVVMWRPIGR
jgi:ribosomal protein S18 acetylase RimI-like enzyme